ncbi:Na(+)-translocating NADH-quinone reductase subunit C [Pseudidiomarina marina]|uniref:Na(+)-translocating NADH-quinone reductase subunit C n=1 Tax=Pseudidiomarina marina TaxID=502366 RepID=A0A432YLB0_9GAMM|nr:Na(+)-translocating NADH-quinone reductase subunit C [Pseudidiomarina marina]PHR63460.1 MAG: Na(+)-translocating NADH-quinone reductase subunit C [Idiomarina sp.]RUO61625.1 Na(+)-translocating NADH-quinone reductase subunit C [Pseudidiomarina marina]
MAKKNESLGKTLFVVIALCLVCAIIVAGSAVGLKPLQQKNAALDMQRNVLDAAGLLTPETDVIAVFEERVETRLFNLNTLEEVDSVDGKNPTEYDPIASAKKAGLGTKLEKSNDLAGIGSREDVAKVYFINDKQGELETVVVYIRGYGLWGTMYGLMAVAPDMNTVKGINYYEHTETPGLGGEIQNPNWTASWEGKEIYENDSVALEVTKNVTDKDHQVDALSGATLTSNGVENTMKFWFSENAYGPLFDKIRKGELN